MRNLILAVVLLLVATVAAAQPLSLDNAYWGVAPGYAKLDDEAELGMASVLVGYSLHPHLGIEARLGSTLIRHEEDIFDETHKFGIDFLGSALVRLNVLTGDTRPYVLLGGTYAKGATSGPYISGSGDTGDFSWGGGISLHVREHGFYLEYLSHIDKSDAELWGVNLGYIGRF